MKQFFNTVLNTLIREVSYPVRAVIGSLLFILGVVSLVLSLRKKNDAHPVAWGWLVLCIISVALAIVYFAL